MGEGFTIILRVMTMSLVTDILSLTVIETTNSSHRDLAIMRSQTISSEY
jgi:hypothetical protein